MQSNGKVTKKSLGSQKGNRNRIIRVMYCRNLIDPKPLEEFRASRRKAPETPTKKTPTKKSPTKKSPVRKTTKRATATKKSPAKRKSTKS